VIKTEAILLVWGVRDEVLKLLPVEGHWLYGEYEFIAKVEFDDWAEMEEFERAIRALINGNTYKLLPVTLSGKKEEAENIIMLESIEATAL
jgi:uncharacterized protein with GYD domain